MARRAYLSMVEKNPACSDALASANQSDVLREQLDYLILHSDAPCEGCVECARFDAVRRILLERFTDRKTGNAIE